MHAINFYIHLFLHTLHFLKEAKNYFDAGQVYAHLLGQPLDLSQAFEVHLGIHPILAADPRGPHQPQPLIHTQGLGMQLAQPRGDAYHIHRFVFSHCSHRIGLDTIVDFRL